MSIANRPHSASPARGRSRARMTGVADKAGEVGTGRDSQAFEQLLALSDRWLPDGQNIVTAAVLCAYAGTMYLPGPPAWLVAVGGSGGSKTERTNPLDNLPGIHQVGDISGPAAFITIGKPVLQEIDKEATGGLLMEIGKGKTGVIVIKDFSSILALPRDTRKRTIAMLRYIFDGAIPRSIGGNGGGTEIWTGKCGLISCVTDEIDADHSVSDDLGPRWLYIRMRDNPDIKSAESAYDNTGQLEIMRSQLRAATHEIFAYPQNPYDGESARQQITNLSMILSRGRSITKRDRQGNLLEVKSAEYPTRIAQSLKQFYLAAGIIGMPEDMAREMLARITLDSVPRIRGGALRVLAGLPAGQELTTGEVGEVARQPDRSVSRALEDLASHGLAVNKNPGRGRTAAWRLTDQARGWFRLSGAPIEPVSTSPALSATPVIRRVSRGRARAHASEAPENNGLPEFSQDVLDEIATAETAADVFKAQE